MGNITDTPAHGNPNGGSPFRNICPNNGYLVDISGTSTDRINQIGGKCSDGSLLPVVGTPAGNSYGYKGPFDFISIRAGSMIDQLFNSGNGAGGSPVELRCPSGSKVVGLYGRSGSWIDQLGAICGAQVSQPVVNTGVPAPAVLPPAPAVLPPAPSTPIVQPDVVTPQVVKPPYSSGPPIGPAYTAPPAPLVPADTSSGTDFDISKYYVWIFLIIVVLVGGMVWNKNRNNKLAAANNAVQLQNLQTQYPTSAPQWQASQPPQQWQASQQQQWR